MEAMEFFYPKAIKGHSLREFIQMHVIEVRDIFTLADIAVQDKKHIFANTLFLLYFLPEACFGYLMMA